MTTEATTNQSKCDNCGVGYGPDDLFCENCGYDFITGSLPPDEAPTASPTAPPPGAPAAAPVVPGATPAAPGDPAAPAPAPAAAPAAPGQAPRVTVDVSVDRAYFDAVVAEGELEFPDPVPAAVQIELAGGEHHVGRTSRSRAIHPDLDVADLNGDPAVSSRHAVIRVAADGALTVTDVGSTNGTYLGDPAADALEVGVDVPLAAGAAVFVGAWTRITVTPLD